METIKRLEEQISSLEQELKIRSPNVTAQEESRSDSNSVDSTAAKLIITLSTKSSDDASPSNQPSTCVKKLQDSNLTDMEISSVDKSSSSLSRLDWAILVEAEDTCSFLEESSNVRVESPVLEVSEATSVLDQDCDNGSRSCTTCIGMMKDAWKNTKGGERSSRRSGAIIIALVKAPMQIR